MIGLPCADDENLNNAAALGLKSTRIWKRSSYQTPALENDNVLLFDELFTSVMLTLSLKVIWTTKKQIP